MLQFRLSSAQYRLSFNENIGEGPIKYRFSFNENITEGPIKKCADTGECHRRWFGLSVWQSVETLINVLLEDCLSQKNLNITMFRPKFHINIIIFC